MTPKEKAQELVDKFRNEITSFLGDNMKKINAKKCALIAVDEILFVLEFNLDFKMGRSIAYYLEVKQEIEKL